MRRVLAKLTRQVPDQPGVAGRYGNLDATQAFVRQALPVLSNSAGAVAFLWSVFNQNSSLACFR